MHRPTLFVSAVTKEFKGARQLVANTLQFLGYEPVWQDIFGTEQGDLRSMLRNKIDGCKGVVQLVGRCYGAEPSVPDESFRRVSYTQYEALYARAAGKRVWYLILDDDFPREAHEEEPAELQALQATYRAGLRKDTHLFHAPKNDDALRARVLEMRQELGRLRREERLWNAGKLALLGVIAAVVIGTLVWQISERRPDATQAETAFASKDYARAFDIYVRLSDSDLTNIRFHQEIEQSARAGRLARQFLARYSALIAQHPDSAVLHNYLGNAHLMLDERDSDGKARAEYAAALRLDPKFAPPLANLAILAFRAGQAQEARRLFERYLAVQPGDAPGWVNLGLLHVAAVEKNPTDATSAKAAELALRKALAADSSLASAYKALGRLSAALGRKADALNAYQRSLALNFEQPAVRQQIELLAWESAGTRPGGTQPDDFKTRSTTATTDAAPPVVTALQLLQQGRFKEAEEVCSVWSKREPRNPLAFRLLGRACEGQGLAMKADAAFANAERLARDPSAATQSELHLEE